ncbi:MAG: cyanophycin synthetase [Bacillota bacterium]|nr:cyanophycin synthetase [Bacillota bacterium]
MHIKGIQTFKGRNIYSHKPVVKMVIDICEFNNKDTKDIPGFNEKLIKSFPGIEKHYCSLGFEGGFGVRLREGTYIGHVTEHLAIELQNLLGYNVHYGKTRIITQPSIYYLVFEYENEKCGVECGRAALKIADCFAKGQEIDIENIINNFHKIAVETNLGPSTRAIYEEAKKRGIPITRIGNDSLLQLGYGINSRRIQASMTDAPSCISVDVAGNKYLTKQILMENKISVPYGDIAYSEDNALDIACEMGYPLAVKPLDANQGKGVTVDIQNNDQLIAAYREALKFSKAVMVERFIKGKDYRVLVVGDKVAAVSERRPPCVVGDGKLSVRELVDELNKDPLRGEDHEKPLTKVKLDEAAGLVLSKQGIGEGYIPKKGETIILRQNGNLSTGGTASDCTDIIHPNNINIAVKAVKALGLDIAGVDIITDDISAPLNQSNGAVIEVNAAPGLRMHLSPTQGKPRNIASDILDFMYPSNSDGTIPIVSITGTNGKTTTTRLIRHTIALTGKKVGMTCTSGVYVGDECLLRGDNTGPVSARMILARRDVEAVVLETARGGIVRKGLGYDLADVGVITNISDDHLGIDGIESIEDLAFVKSLVIEAIKPDGYAVINADDKMAGYLLNRVKGKVILFSTNEKNPLVEEHSKNGGQVVFIRDNFICIKNGKEKTKLINIEQIPITYGGMVECNIENSLAAVAALYALNLPLNIINKGLYTFRPDLKLNPGRFNIFEMGNFKVMLDYGHNSAGYSAVINFARKIGSTRLVGVIGVPGDRLDRNIRDIGQICGNSFSCIYIKEDRDLRGRKPGEVADLLYDSVIKSGMNKENIKVIHSELKALESAVLDAQPGDLIIMLYEEFDAAVELINRLKNELEQNSIPSIEKIEETINLKTV